MRSLNYKISIISLLFGLFYADEALNTELIAQFPYDEGINDCWGYTNSEGREFAVVGTNSGTSIVEITADSLFESAFIPGGESIWRDIKSWGDYIYIGTENNSGGIQVVSMEDPDIPELVYTWEGMGSSHNIMVSEGYLYVIGASDVAYLIILSLEDPAYPEQVGIWNEEYLHDICFDGDILYGCGIYTSTMFAIDISEPQNPQTINYWDNVPSAHACWPTEDGQYLLTASETSSGHIMIWDVNDLYNVNLVSEWLPEGAEWESAHNVFVRDNYAYMSYYKYGLQIIDITDPYVPTLAGYYDTYPSDEGGLYNGAWGTYPFQQSCNLYISDRESGLFVVSFDGCTGADYNDPMPPSDVNVYSDYLSPEYISLTWTNPETYFDESPLDSFLIEIYRNEELLIEITDGIEIYDDAWLIDGNYYTYEISTIDITTDSSSTTVISSAYCGGSPYPSEPQGFSATSLSEGIELIWTNPTTQSDGTYLDDLISANIYRNGSVIANIETVMGDVSSYMDTPPEGYIYTYYITSIDNEIPSNESEPTEPLEVYAGSPPEYLIWEPSDNTPLSGEAIIDDLEILGEQGFLTEDLWVFGNPLDQNFEAMFILNGIFPNSHRLSINEQLIIEEYLAGGGSVFMEDGDIWYQYVGEGLIDYFQCHSYNDGEGDLSMITGLSNVFTEDLTFNYSGENNWIDQLRTLSSAFPILVNSDPEYITAVAYDSGDYRTIASSFEYGGLTDSDERRELLASILDFLQNGGSPNWVAGDINQDDEIDILDIIMLVDFILEIYIPSPIEYWTSNMNQDDMLDIMDIMLIIQVILD